MSISSSQAGRLASSLLGFKVLDSRPFGVGKFSETFLIKDSALNRFVLRVSPPDSLLQLFYERRMMRQEPNIHQIIRSQTTVPVPEILASDFTRELIDRDFLIMPLIPGRPLRESSLKVSALSRAFREWGRYVSEIHQVTSLTGKFGYLGEHNCMEPQDSWRSAFQIMLEKELADIKGVEAYSDSECARIMDLFHKYSEVFEESTRSTLCHGDLWVTNLLVKSDGRVTGLLDFDRACWGDFEWDLAIAEYCGVTRPSFWQGYRREVEVHSGPASIRRFFYLLYEHMKYIIISLSSRRNDPGRAERYATQCLNMVASFERTGEPVFR